MISDETLTNLPSSVPRGKRVKCGADSVDVEREEQSGAGFAYDCMKVYSYQSEMRFAYDGWNMIAEVGQRPPDAPSANLYVWGLDLSGSLQGAGGIGGLLAAQLGTNSVFYTYDGNGNVSELINTLDGTIAAHYEYSPFGETIVATGPLADDNPFRFSTKYFVDELGIGDWGYRWYFFTLGRFGSKDPIGERGGVLLYGFVQNNTVNNVDILGMSIWDYLPITGWIRAYFMTIPGQQVSDYKTKVTKKACCIDEFQAELDCQKGIYLERVQFGKPLAEDAARRFVIDVIIAFGGLINPYIGIGGIVDGVLGACGYFDAVARVDQASKWALSRNCNCARAQ